MQWIVALGLLVAVLGCSSGYKQATGFVEPESAECASWCMANRLAYPHAKAASEAGRVGNASEASAEGAAMLAVCKEVYPWSTNHGTTPKERDSEQALRKLCTGLGYPLR